MNSSDVAVNAEALPLQTFNLLNCATDTIPHNSNVHKWYGKSQYHFPFCISPISLCPDLVDTIHTFVVELTECFETGFEEAADQKQKIYWRIQRLRATNHIVQMSRDGVISVQLSVIETR